MPKPTNAPAWLGAAIHTQRRLRERYGVELPLRHYRRLCRAAARSRFRCRDGRHGRNEVAVTPWRGEHLTLAYDPSSRLVLTALPFGAWQMVPDLYARIRAARLLEETDGWIL